MPLGASWRPLTLPLRHLHHSLSQGRGVPVSVHRWRTLSASQHRAASACSRRASKRIHTGIMCVYTPPLAARCRRARPAALGCRCTSPRACPAPSAHHLAIGCGCPLWGAPRSCGDGRLSGVLPPLKMQSSKLRVRPASRMLRDAVAWLECHSAFIQVSASQAHQRPQGRDRGAWNAGMQRKRMRPSSLQQLCFIPAATMEGVTVL